MLVNIEGNTLFLFVEAVFSDNRNENITNDFSVGYYASRLKLLRLFRIGLFLVLPIIPDLRGRFLHPLKIKKNGIKLIGIRYCKCIKKVPITIVIISTFLNIQ